MINIFIYMYIYIYMCTYVYTYIYIYISHDVVFKINLARGHARACLRVCVQDIYIMIAINMYKFTKNGK